MLPHNGRLSNLFARPVVLPCVFLHRFPSSGLSFRRFDADLSAVFHRRDEYPRSPKRVRIFISHQKTGSAKRTKPGAFISLLFISIALDFGVISGGTFSAGSVAGRTSESYVPKRTHADSSPMWKCTVARNYGERLLFYARVNIYSIFSNRVAVRFV